MRLRSFDDLNAPLAWRRVRTWAQSLLMDIPDRLPYEVLDRLFGDTGPPIGQEHNFHRAVLVVSSKQSGTIRPFVRVHPLDLIVYQALVDQLAPTIEAALPPSDRVGAYRQTLDEDSDHAFRADPRNDEFKAGISSAIEGMDSAYVLQTDISGYFLGISHERLRTELWEATDRPEAVSDLCELLAAWQDLGIRGLPQGLRPSSPLANFYLAPLDRLLGASEVPFFRWSDDMWAICESFADARRVQDRIERHLYGIGLTLNGEKTKILRADTALARLKPAKERFERKRDELLDELLEGMEDDPYVDAAALPDPEDVERDVVISEVDRLTAALSEVDLPDNFHADWRQSLRELEAIEDPCAVAVVPALLRRAPDLIDHGLRYVVAVADSDPDAAAAVFTELLSREHSGRDHERLVACHRALSLPGTSAELAEPLGVLALKDDHPLVRAKALVAWGKHSKPSAFGVVDQFLAAAEPPWRVYAFVAMQRKKKAARRQRFDLWGGAGGGLGQLADTLDDRQIKWSKL